MGDRVKALRRENDDLKRQLNELKKEFQSIKEQKYGMKCLYLYENFQKMPLRGK